jgi:MFS superfamily sulfate permease-like transporter
MNPAHFLKYLLSGLPLLSTLKEYRLAWLSKDAIAGLSACIVSIPSVIAYAELVHLPPITGLYAALAAAIGYALFSSSRHVIAGPDAAIGLLAGSAILPLAAGDPARIVSLAAVLGILSGGVHCRPVVASGVDRLPQRCLAGPDRHPTWQDVPYQDRG